MVKHVLKMCEKNLGSCSITNMSWTSTSLKHIHLAKWLTCHPKRVKLPILRSCMLTPSTRQFLLFDSPCLFNTSFVCGSHIHGSRTRSRSSTSQCKDIMMTWHRKSRTAGPLAHSKVLTMSQNIWNCTQQKKLSHKRYVTRLLCHS